MSSLVEVLPSLLTGTFALVGVYLANIVQVKSTKLKQSKDKLSKDLERLEQLYTIIDELKGKFFVESILYLGYQKGDFTKEELHQHQRDSKKVDLRQAKMLVGLYFPNLAEDMQDLDQVCLFTFYVHGMVHAKDNTPEPEDIIENLGKCTEVCEQFLEKVSAEANIYNKQFKSDS
ncbi:TPA: hypothetical protein NJ582_004489 [Vibrio parahaemolyticus]|nr:hypothetical protein [Vibrio parahaemolyticus]